MSRDAEKTRLFTRRAVLIGSAKISLLSLLLGRLYYLQILQNDRFSVLAEDNRISLRLLAPPRGQVLDRTGAPLAVNQQNYRLVLLPEQVRKLDPLLDALGAYVPLPDNERKRIHRDFKRNDGLTAVLVADNLTWDQVAIISLHMPELSGADIEAGELRTYPYALITAHVVGYVGPFSLSDKENGQEDAAIPGFRVGKNGIERTYDTELRGRPGNVQLEVNARGRVVRELTRIDPVVGDDVKLTLDIGLQQMVEQRISDAESAAAVAMDIYTGAVYALVSHPGFDPNLFTYGISHKDWEELNTDEHTPLMNKVLDGVYAPGSTFKIVTALAGLDAGILDPREQVFCPGYMDLGQHRFHCWKKGGHGPVDFVHAMAGSCDTYFYEMGKRVGIDRMHAMAKRLGLGEKTDIDLPHERSGLVPSRVWKLTTKGSSWQLGETLISAIGQGYNLVTPMQLALMLARVANGGFAVKPYLFRPSVDERPPDKPWGEDLGFDPAHLSVLRDALFAVVNLPIGTAHAAAASDAKLTMAGKTGTAQVRRITMAERDKGVLTGDALAWKERDHALFTGYAPIDNPRYVAAVVIEHGGSGAHIAAPIVRDILIECQKRNLR